MKYRQIIDTGGNIPIPESFADKILLIKSDYFRHYGTTCSLIKMWMKTFSNQSFRYSFWLRMSQKIEGKKTPFYYLSKFTLLRLARKYNIFLLDDTMIGFGLYLGHGFSIVCNESTIIGNNCNLSHFVSIGTNDNNGATLGDNVYIGPNVSIVGNVIIGNNSTVGAGAVVVNNVSEKMTVGGVPARVISENSSHSLIQHPWPLN